MVETLLPVETSATAADGEVRVDVRTDENVDVIGVLASECARNVFGLLCEEPATASDVADAVGTSLQNAHHHLGRLEGAGLVEVVDTWYSAKGVEMNVYAATTGRIVIDWERDPEPAR